MRLLPVVALIAACAHSPAGQLRFRNEPPVWRVNDRKPLPAAPAPREYNRSLYHTDGFFVRRATRAMELRPSGRATDVNALDEVPDSTWFTNRLGIRKLSLDELRTGPNTDGSPFDNLPWTITKAKTGGTAIGFIFEDARGAKYILKFDAAERPEMETAAHAIVHRILWACGYNVPQDFIGYVRRDDLVIGEKAKKRGLDPAKLDHALDQVAHADDGRIRVLASRLLPGKVIGPYAREGTRADDPNDVIPHEQRRSLRGQFPIFAWLDHTDIQEDNTLDIFVDDHVEHYLIDFGKALGVMAAGLHWKTVGYTYRLDLGLAARSLVTLGLWDRPWDHVSAPALRGVGLFEAKHFDPGEWRPNSIYWPLEDKDRFDGFWGAKLVMRFTREQLTAIVDEGQLTDPRAAAYLVDTLVERQRATAAYWFARVAPLDEFAFDRDWLCFTDLAQVHRLDHAATMYRVRIFDRNGTATARESTLAPSSTGRTCTRVAVDRYTIVEVRVQRGDRVLPPVLVHAAPDASQAPRVIGIRRE